MASIIALSGEVNEGGAVRSVFWHGWHGFHGWEIEPEKSKDFDFSDTASTFGGG
jgi:hypothetical protein